ncbi:MAG: exodeoxyribonuclease VII large subunit [Alysiella sp.]|uniref:exodeoxyribonuclease VII large subunit n=1 Tax=Alysiella sp. TaxID=1872483 RepID=UPI0026DCF0E6|nr:exodeoxyribonuclease VII large subunit [Alysiella sp.]MDO4433777.1 exodeoxyribonuclease VII large subunit [Alysiella sp.]
MNHNDLFTPNTLSVSELNAIARQLLENQFQGIWVSGEVSNLTRAVSGHYYFSLKDNHAQIRCALFKSAAQRLSQALKEGDHIEVSGKISIYEARGEFQITVHEVRQIGLGVLYERYEKLKQHLQQEGLFAAEHKKKLPENPCRIGIISSLAAAALHDVLSTLARRAPHIPLIIYPTAVQGTGSEKQITTAIQTASQRAETDVLIVCRGGGSIEDLWSFNEEMVVRAIANCTIPIVSGVGHETDFTLCDFAADLRAPTPTAAAELVSPDRNVLLAQTHRFQAALTDLLQQHHHNAAQKTDFLAQQLLHPQQKWHLQHQRLTHQKQQLDYIIRQQYHYQQQRLNTLQQRILSQRPQIVWQQHNLLSIQHTLKHHTQFFFRQQQQKLQQQNHILQAISPQQVLQRGFVVVKNTRGSLISDAKQLKAGQKLQLIFANSQADVQVSQQQKQSELFD